MTAPEHTAMRTDPDHAHDRPRAAPLRGWLGALALLALSAAPACNIVGPAVYFIGGPEKAPAVYTLDKDRPTVIFVDDRFNRVPQRSSRDLIGVTAEQLLLDEELLTDAIQSRQATAAARRERFSEPLTVAQVGTEVGAEVVVYATVDEFTVSVDGSSHLPRAVLRVKVVDAASGQRLWPEPGAPADAHTLTVTARQQRTPISTRAERAQAEQDLARWAGIRLARLFFEASAELDPRELSELR
ncbi:MAG: hypothetical protein C0468_00400 [Planctomyces sp.]|nr:hypothetical protein [Planctomyces sp.]